MNWWTCHSPADRVVRGVVAFLLLALAASSADLPWFALTVAVIAVILAIEAATGRGINLLIRKR